MKIKIEALVETIKIVCSGLIEPLERKQEAQNKPIKKLEALDIISNESGNNTSNLFRDSPIVELIKKKKMDDDPRIGRLCWVWDNGENPKTSAYKIKKIHPNGVEIVPPCSGIFTYAELVKPEEL